MPKESVPKIGKRFVMIFKLNKRKQAAIRMTIMNLKKTEKLLIKEKSALDLSQSETQIESG